MITREKITLTNIMDMAKDEHRKHTLEIKSASTEEASFATDDELQRSTRVHTAETTSGSLRQQLTVSALPTDTSPLQMISPDNNFL